MDVCLRDGRGGLPAALSDLSAEIVQVDRFVIPILLIYDLQDLFVGEIDIGEKPFDIRALIQALPGRRGR